MRLTILAPALSVVTLAAPHALAQEAATGSFDPVAAVRGFLTDADLLGADAATVGSVTAEGEAVIATDVSMRWQTTFEADGDTVILSAAATMDRVEITGLAAQDGGFSAEEVSIPEASLLVAVEGAEEPLSYDVTIGDYRLVDASWPAFPQIEADPSRPVSRFAPLVDWSVNQSYARNEVGTIEGVVITGDGRQEISYGPISVGPVVNGTLESFEYGPVETTQEMEVPTDEGGNEAANVSIRYGASRGENLDARPLAALLTGIGAGDGPQVVLGSTVLDGIDVDAGAAFSMSVGENRIENLTVDTSGAPLMERLDPIVVAALDADAPAPDALLPLVLDLYGAFGVGAYVFSDIEVAGSDFTMAMGEFVMEGLSRAGLDLFAIRGTEVNTPDGSGSLAAFELESLVFPEREAFMSTVMGGLMGMQPDLRATLDAAPYLGRLTVSGLEATTPMTGSIALGLFETRLEEFVEPIPTSIVMTLEGLSLPAAALGDPQMAGMAQAIGADPVTADADIELDWDEDTQDVDLELDLSVGAVGEIEGEARLGGIPRVIFENPARAQEALATASLGDMTLTFSDDGLTDFVLGMMSEQTGLSRQEFIQGIVQQIQMQGQMLGGDTALVAQVSNAVSAFLAEPRSLSLSMDPPAPVPFAQVMGAAMTAPNALPGLLGFAVSANADDE